MKKAAAFLFFILYSAVVFLFGIFCTAKKAGPVIIERQKNLEKHQKLFSVLETWLKKKQQGKSMTVFLERNNYHSIAVYGLGNIGKLLENELKGGIKICYGIDRREITADFPVYKPDDDLPVVDMVIVTAAYEFEEIEEALKKKLNCPIYSIEDITYFMD